MRTINSLILHQVKFLWHNTMPDLFRFVMHATSLALDMFTFFVHVHCEKLPTAKLTEPCFLPVKRLTDKYYAIFGQDGGNLGFCQFLAFSTWLIAPGYSQTAHQTSRYCMSTHPNIECWFHANIFRVSHHLESSIWIYFMHQSGRGI